MIRWAAARMENRNSTDSLSLEPELERLRELNKELERLRLALIFPEDANAEAKAEPAVPSTATPIGTARDNEPTFHLFAKLPAELRVKIWQQSLEPRVVELHTRRGHYADDFRHGGHLKWHSQCTNPAALSVCVESREVALERYTVALPLAVPPRRHETPQDSFRIPQAWIPGDSVDSHRHVLYLDPARDTVALLGGLDLKLLKELLDGIRHEDPRGLKRLGMSASCFVHRGGVSCLAMYAMTVFRHLHELVLFMYSENMPPEDWPGGRCNLEDCSDKDFFRAWEMGAGNQLKGADNRWVAVGSKGREIRIMDLMFLP
ncbi:hypothetical protein MGG_15233 [Pyricularia oryzae 70-15]|uniref:2EXR domain-containing protein n=1 Tax=Pyricularia oryzae (strain 70-15 / ATCC MYA-4617 / FGSC 8958) TaxID=242507 RepID=G4N4J0_PYRO7|nr:uncharacterized protein MGG_15233 [Pyricularia oryzae 70-15]EHA52005.1 hypothetical protein MGG_15233 [Pyricularia oryzae 70-15]